MIRLALVTMGGLGLIRPAPGTWGSVPPAVAAGVLCGVDPGSIAVVMAALALVASMACLGLSAWAARHFKCEDPPQMVLDETAGMALALIPLPWMVLTLESPQPWVAVGAVVLTFGFFRALDILKPGPINRVQQLAGGWGVLVDDLFAGAVAAGCTWAVLGVLLLVS